MPSPTLHRPAVPVALPRIVLGRLARIAALAALPFLAVPATAAPADCELALHFAKVVAEHGQRAADSQNYVYAGDEASAARIPSIDAYRFARTCPCPDALRPLLDAQDAAARSNASFNATGAQQYGQDIRKKANEAVAALSACVARNPAPSASPAPK